MSVPAMFNVPSAYDRFMGRYSVPLARVFAAELELEPGQRALDVGCGPGALTQVLVELLGAAAVSAVDPSAPFVEAVRERLPGVDARVGPAESLSFEDDAFDRAVAQLVFHFVSDGEQSARELRRVTRPGGRVAACVWDSGGAMTMLHVIRRAILSVDPQAAGELKPRPYSTEGALGELFRSVGLEDVTEGLLTVRAEYADFDDVWQPFLAGVGPDSSLLLKLGSEDQAAVREEFRRLIGSPEGAFGLDAGAWYVVGRA
jgi:ubiquinone/menaquinone biosynthesis C-methylase UbiE